VARNVGKVGIASLLTILVATPFVAKHEGVVLRTYADPVGIPTACGGETDRAITMRQRFTRDECMALLGASLHKHALELDRCITRPLAEHEAAAVLSFGYNVGTGAACKSTLVRLLNSGAPAATWCAELSKWTYAKGRQLPGLVRRRAAERAMCEGRA